MNIEEKKDSQILEEEKILKNVPSRNFILDHASSKIDMFNQVSLGVSDISRSKGLYEQHVKVLNY